MRFVISLIFATCFLIPKNATAFNTNYNEYHRGIIVAEEAIFIKNNFQEGLDAFTVTFNQFDFVFVDDCIEAFQLALFFKRDDYAMVFIKKALMNGFELKLLDSLSLFTQSDFNTAGKYLTIHKDFIKKHKSYLEAYSRKCYGNYLKRIDKDLLVSINKRHVTEQLFKDNWEIIISKGEIDKNKTPYQLVCDDNLSFIDSLAKHHIFIGERLLGIYTNKLMASLEIITASTKNYREYLLTYYKLPANTHVSIVTESDYFGLNPTYNMLFHNKNTYPILLKYKNEAIKSGYWHPREFASLKFNVDRTTLNDSTNLYLERYYKVASINTREIDKERANLLLPSYEVDHQKNLFAIKNNLKLSFGFFNGTK